jgi:hypothetical protein
MACARIRNKPVKFLDPHDKLVLELREEVKRLRDENRKLRQTMGTAPVHGSSSYVDSNDDYLRASSAESPNNRRSPSKLKAGMAGGGNGAAAGMKKKVEHVPSARHADFLAKHGKAGGKKLKKKKKTSKPPDADDDILQLLQNNSSAGTHSNHRYGRGGGGDDNDDDSIGHSVQSGASSQHSKQRKAGVESMIKGVHPMVFKNSEDMVSVRDSSQTKGLSPLYVANNYERSLEAARIEELERRMARIELVEKARLSQDGNGEEIGEHSKPSGSQIAKGKKQKKSHVSGIIGCCCGDTQYFFVDVLSHCWLMFLSF